MLSFGHPPSGRWLTLAVLPAFLSFLLQPQVTVLHHAHRGGDSQHIHARPQLPLPLSHDHHHHDHHHDHSVHHHPHDAHLQQAHSHEPATSSRGRRSGLRQDRVQLNAHWHLTIVCHWVGLAYQEPQSPIALVWLLQQAAASSTDVSLVLAFQPRAPPSFS